MKKFSEQLHKKSQTVKLKAAERRELRERVISYMEYHPLPGSAKVGANPKPSPYFTEQFVLIPARSFLKGGAIFAMLVLIAIPALAERAVPGDGLYAIKVSFNEELRSTLAFTPYQKIEWETTRLNRRIAEARLLASEGRLTDEVEAEVAAAVKTHTENAKRGIEELRTEDEEEATLASIELNTTLEVQAATLDDSDEVVEEGGERPTRLLATVVKEAAADEDSTAPTMPSYDRLMARVETNTTRVQELLTSLNLTETSEDYVDITRRLEDINRTVEEAILTKDTDDATARALLVDALQRTQRLIVFMTEIQQDQAFELEDFVPVVLTPEEQTGQIVRLRSSTAEQIEQIETLLASSTDEAVAEKVGFGLDTLRDLNEQMNQSESYTEITDLYEEASALASSMIVLFDAARENREAVVAEERPETAATGTATSSEEEITIPDESAPTSTEMTPPSPPAAEATTTPDAI